MSAWQPIATAPEKTELLVLRRDGQMHVAKVSGFDCKYGILSADFGNANCSFFFPIDNNYTSNDAPAYWQLLPALPDSWVSS